MESPYWIDGRNSFGAALMGYVGHSRVPCARGATTANNVSAPASHIEMRAIFPSVAPRGAPSTSSYRRIVVSFWVVPGNFER